MVAWDDNGCSAGSLYVECVAENRSEVTWCMWVVCGVVGSWSDTNYARAYARFETDSDSCDATVSWYKTMLSSDDVGTEEAAVYGLPAWMDVVGAALTVTWPYVSLGLGAMVLAELLLSEVPCLSDDHVVKAPCV